MISYSIECEGIPKWRCGHFTFYDVFHFTHDRVLHTILKLINLMQEPSKKGMVVSANVFYITFAFVNILLRFRAGFNEVGTLPNGCEMYNISSK